MSDFQFRIGQLRDRTSTADGARVFIMEAVGGALSGWKFAATSRDPEYRHLITTSVYDLHEATSGAQIATVNWIHIAKACIGAARGLPSDPFKVPENESRQIWDILEPFRRFGSTTWPTEWTSAMNVVLREGPNYPTFLRNWLSTQETYATMQYGNRKAAKRVRKIFG